MGLCNHLTNPLKGMVPGAELKVLFDVLTAWNVIRK